MKIENTLFDVAKRFLGVNELARDKDNPFILWCLSVCGIKDTHDETPWCSAFVNGICFILGITRSGSAAARSWLKIGTAIDIKDAQAGNDVVIFKRGTGKQPGPEVLDAPGHVAFYVKLEGETVLVLGGNQSNSVSLGRYPVANILGVRRLA